MNIKELCEYFVLGGGHNDDAGKLRFREDTLYVGDEILCMRVYPTRTWHDFLFLVNSNMKNTEYSKKLVSVLKTEKIQRVMAMPIENPLTWYAEMSK